MLQLIQKQFPSLLHTKHFQFNLLWINILDSKSLVSIPLAKSLNTQLVKWITKGYHPFSVVDDVEFRKFTQMLNPGYLLPSRKTISNGLLRQIYNDCVQKVKKKFQDIEGVCLTVDSWISINNDSFYAVTAHFINNNDELDSALLKCQEFGDRHTAANIRQLILSTTEK